MNTSESDMEQNVFAIDIGYSNLKVAFGDSAIPRVLVLPAGAGLAENFSEQVSSTAVNNSEGGEFITVDGKNFIAGIDQNHIRVKRHRNPNYTMTKEWMALYFTGLIKTEATEIGLAITGLPAEQSRDVKLCERVAARMRGKHQVKPDRVVTVHDAVVVAQPVGAYVDAGFQAASESIRQIIRDGRVLSLDIGYYSVDWGLFDGSRSIKAVSGSNNSAMSAVIETVIRKIEQQHDDKITPERVEQSLRSARHTILFHGHELDLTPYLQEALVAVNEDTATDLLNAKNLDREQIDLVVLAGGGAEHYRSAAERAFPGSPIVISPRPVAANVRGYWYLQRAQYLASTARTALRQP